MPPPAGSSNDAPPTSSSTARRGGRVVVAADSVAVAKVASTSSTVGRGGGGGHRLRRRRPGGGAAVAYSTACGTPISGCGGPTISMSVDVELVCRLVFEHGERSSRPWRPPARHRQRDGPAVPVAEPELVVRPRLTEDRVGDRADLTTWSTGTVAVRELGRYNERLRDAVAADLMRLRVRGGLLRALCTVSCGFCAAGVRAFALQAR